MKLTEAEALDHVRHMLFAARKARSIALESNTEEEFEKLHRLERSLGLPLSSKWLIGKWCVIPALAKVIDRGYVTPVEFLNFMTVAQWQSEIWALAYVDSDRPINLPTPDECRTIRAWSLLEEK
jgi:hypothetical protein